MIPSLPQVETLLKQTDKVPKPKTDINMQTQKVNGNRCLPREKMACKLLFSWLQVEASLQLEAMCGMGYKPACYKMEFPLPLHYFQLSRLSSQNIT